MTDDFIKKTNEEYAAWCKTYYNPEALDERGMQSLHGLWAWQEQERRMEELCKQLAEARAEVERLSAGWAEANDSFLSCRIAGIGERDELQRQLAAAQTQSARRLKELCKFGIENDQLRQQLATFHQLPEPGTTPPEKLA